VTVSVGSLVITKELGVPGERLISWLVSIGVPAGYSVEYLIVRSVATSPFMPRPAKVTTPPLAALPVWPTRVRP
jgi:hypothetical protein